MTDTKTVKGYQLKVGDQVECYHTGDGFVSTGPVVASTKDGITLAWRDGTIAVKNLPYDYDYEVMLTHEEFKAKYEAQAVSVINALKNRVESYELGEHTMDNGWTDIDAYQMAKYCSERNIRPYGVCYNITPRQTFCGELLDVGICAVDADGDKIWCHYKKEWLEEIFDNWEREHEKK